MASTETALRLAPEPRHSGGEDWEGKEMVEGEILETDMTGEAHMRVLSAIHFEIEAWRREQGHGVVLVGEGGVILNDRTRYAFDLAWRADETPYAGFLTKVPELVVEIASPTNVPHHLMRKLEDYLAFGAKQTWLVFPETRRVLVLNPDLSARLFKANETLTPGDWMPKFSLNLEEVFVHLGPDPAETEGQDS